jgi:hypothetical protein
MRTLCNVEYLKTLFHSMPLVSSANIQNPLALGFEVSVAHIRLMRHFAEMRLFLFFEIRSLAVWELRGSYCSEHFGPHVPSPARASASGKTAPGTI